MRAVRLHATRDLRFETVEAPLPPAPGEVTLRVTAAGICGSDLHNYATGAWITRAPSVAGHEFTGVVTALGADVAHVSLGQCVIVDSRHICGSCPACTEGNGQVCDELGFIGEKIDGGFAEAVTLPARNVAPAPEGVPDRHLAMVEPLAVALHAVRRLDAPEGAEVVVTGCGPIGGLVTLLLTRAGHPVRVIDLNPARVALVCDATGATPAPLDALPRFRFAVDTTGAAPVISALVAQIAGCSRLALVGIGAAKPLLDPVHLVEREITLLGCHAYGPEFFDVAPLLPALAPALDAFIAAEIPLEAVPGAYDALLAGDSAGLKTIIRCTPDQA
ncbi:zinc-dependent alcohol dehydrogenase [Pseudooceanicola sp. 200-1SW]|uniref:zinc-dependent alcohol dehydrogenase n=1 Tax=Pseudooceanicola sp. 200-1SW TaxID=3425949 RepID=UPI003D7F3FBA